MLEQLTEMVPWMSVEEFRMYESKLGDTYKAILKRRMENYSKLFSWKINVVTTPSVSHRKLAVRCAAPFARPALWG